MHNTQSKIREGDLHSVIVVEDISFQIRYGYYADYEREHWDPEPIFPDLKNNPVYTSKGMPVVTQMQDVCENFKLHPSHDNDGRCADCIYFYNEGNKLIGLCRCEKRRL